MFKPINGWTKQRMLEHVKREFKGKSENLVHYNTCLYRGPNGTKCAVGMFIPDKLYDSGMDDGSQNDVESLLSEHAELAKIMPLDLLVLKEFQSIHDNSSKDACLSNIIQWIDKNVEE